MVTVKLDTGKHFTQFSELDTHQWFHHAAYPDGHICIKKTTTTAILFRNGVSFPSTITVAACDPCEPVEAELTITYRYTGQGPTRC